MTNIDETFGAVFSEAVASGAHVGGAAIAATADAVIYESGFGTRTAGGDPVPADQLFRIASMTKAMVTAGVLQLAERGHLNLDDPIATVIPAATDLQVLDGFDGDTPILRAPASAPTIRQLLNHTAGFGYAFLNADLGRYHEVTGTPSPLLFSRTMFDLPLVNDPGTAWEYGINTDWAGQVIERVTGQTLGDYLTENLWLPLGMTQTTFTPDAAAQQALMPMHSRLPDGSLVPNGVELPNPPEVHSGGGGSYSTVGDYARFMRALLRGGELDGTRILSAESVELMFTPALGDISLPAGITSSDPALTNDVEFPPLAQNFSLGLHLFQEDLPGLRKAGSGDWSGLTNCYYWIDRASGVCGAVLTQVLPYWDEPIVGTALGFEAAVYESL